MPAGRPAQPYALKVLRGKGAGKDGEPRDSGGRKITKPPAFKRVAPAKPKTLSPAASIHWDEIVPELARLDVLKPNDIGGLVSMCEAWAVYIEALQRIQADGLVIATGSEGMLRQHPAFNSFIGAGKEYRSWAVQFGLTPSSEGRLKPKEADSGKDDDPFD